MIRTATSALLPLGDALDLLCGRVAPVASRRVALAEARGRVAACSVRARRAVPEQLSALRDGFAIDAATVGGASVYAPIPLSRLPRWVEAGDILPAGTDAVLPQEGLEGGAVVADIGVGEGVRAPGGEIGAGQVLVAAGASIGPLKLLGLAASGVDTVDIRLPRLHVILSGATAPDTLSSLLAQLIQSHGGVAEIVTVQNRVEDLAESMRGGSSDAIVVLGGSGLGRTDQSAAAIACAGELQAHGIALRPGETAAVGTAADRPVLLVPGRPEAAIAVFLTLGRPLLDKLTGALPSRPHPGLLLRKIVSAIGLTEVVFVRSRPEGVEPLGGAELPIHQLLEADGAVVVAPESEGYPPGAKVEVWSL